MKARAQFAFRAEAEGELSFNENDELIITSQGIGNGWWSAMDSFGKTGIIPESYVEISENASLPIQPTVHAEEADYSNITTQVDNVSLNQAAIGVDPWTKSWDEVQHHPKSEVQHHPKPAVQRQFSSVDASSQRSLIHQHSAHLSSIQHSANAIADAKRQAQRSRSNPNQNDSDFDDDYEDSYSTLSPESREISSIAAGAKTVNRTIKARLFDSKGIEAFLIHGVKISPSESDMAVVTRNTSGDFEWEPRDNTVIEYEISATTEASKLAGLKQFTNYRILPINAVTGNRGVQRRFKQFDWLHGILIDKYRLLCIPGLPEKQVTGRFEAEFIEARKYQLQLWVNRIASHPIIRTSPAVLQFLKKDLNCNSNLSVKDWKRFKRETENDNLKGSNWFAAIRPTTMIPTNDADTIVDNFNAFLQHFERCNNNLMLTISRFIENHGVISREFNKLSQSIMEMSKVVAADNQRSACKELSVSLTVSGKAYNKIAKNLSTLGPAGLNRLSFILREFQTMNASISQSVGIQKAVREVLANVRNRDQGRIPPDVIKRTNSINGAILAEIVHYDKSRKADYKKSMKTFIISQKELFQKIVDDLTEAEQAFE